MSVIAAPSESGVAELPEPLFDENTPYGEGHKVKCFYPDCQIECSTWCSLMFHLKRDHKRKQSEFKGTYFHEQFKKEQSEFKGDYFDEQFKKDKKDKKEKDEQKSKKAKVETEDNPKTSQFAGIKLDDPRYVVQSLEHGQRMPKADDNAVAAIFHQLEIWRAANPTLGDRPTENVWYHLCRARLIDDGVLCNFYGMDICRNIVRRGLKKHQAGKNVGGESASSAHA